MHYAQHSDLIELKNTASVQIITIYIVGAFYYLYLHNSIVKLIYILSVACNKIPEHRTVYTTIILYTAHACVCVGDNFLAY